MKKYIFSFALVCSYFLASTQINFQIANANGNKNDTVSIPVTTTGFNNVLGVQYSINYDSSILAVVDVIKSVAFDVDYATHIGSATVKNGQITFIWFSALGTPVNITNGTLLFTMRFKLIGKECDSSFVKLSSNPTKIDAFDGNFNSLTLAANDGKVKINGSGCVVTPPPDSVLQILASNDTTPQGVVKCIKITCKNFNNLQTGQFTIRWDKTIAKFNNLVSGAFNLINGQGYTSLPDSSGVAIVWFSETTPITLADGTTLFEICLKPVGPTGSRTPINFDGSVASVEFTNGNGDVVTPKFVPGSLTIATAPAAILKLYIRDTSVDNCGEFCIPIRVDNFNCVETLQFGMIFDTTKLKFKRITGLNLYALAPPNFFIIRDSIRVQWDDQTLPQTKKNGDSIFMVCFESLLSAPNCPFDTKITFTDLGTGIPMAFSDCNGNDFVVVKGEGNIHVKCCAPPPPVTIKLGDRTAVKCFDDCNGSIKKTMISGGIGPFLWEWKVYKVGGTFSTVPEPMDLCEGTYYLNIIDVGNANAVTSSDTFHIDSPSKIRLTAVITHVQVVNDGKIDVTVYGGTPLFKFVWRRLSSHTKIATTENIMNQPAGMYEDSITDANGCIFVDTFIINPAPLTCAGFVLLDSNRCFGDCKAVLFLSVNGGYNPQTFKWSNGDKGASADSLCAGIVTATITDASGTSITCSYKITEPDKIEITLDSIKKSSGQDGAIYITPKGGTKPYKFQWKNDSGTIVSSNEDLKNAAPGTYMVCITDSLNCVQCLSGLVIMPTNVGPPPTITVSLAIDPHLGGNAVSCRGVCDGKIIVTVVSSDPKLPYKYRWSQDTTLNSNIATKLCPNQFYTVTVTDAAGNSKVSSSLFVSDAPIITLKTNKINCASKNTISDGKYEAAVTGAVPPISYIWCNGNINSIANDLPSGNCNVQITDINGCSLSQTFLVCLDNINITPSECYHGRLAISPNGDGYNDVFEIACALDFDNVLTIYDRWGNMVYTKVNYTNDWNGVNKDGDNLTEGTYLWVLKVKEAGKEDAYYKGTVTIVR